MGKRKMHTCEKLEEMCMEMEKKKKTKRKTCAVHNTRRSLKRVRDFQGLQGRSRGKGEGGIRLQRQLAAHEIRNSKARNQYTLRLALGRVLGRLATGQLGRERERGAGESKGAAFRITQLIRACVGAAAAASNQFHCGNKHTHTHRNYTKKTT